MPFCPKCRYEYRANITICPDCNEALVSVLPEEAITNMEGWSSEKDWMAVAILTSSQYAQMVEEGLREQGIPVLLYSKTGHFGETGQMGLTNFNPAGAGIIVLVPADRVDDANEAAEALIGDIWSKSRVNPTVS